MIYFVQPLDGGPVKIGYSDDVAGRVKSLEHHYGQPLSLLATMDGGREQEKQIHARFAHLRFGRTEQFRPAPDLMAFIGRPLLVSANPDSVEEMDIVGAVVLATFKGSEEMRAWFDGLVEAGEMASRSHALKRAVKLLAADVGYAEPMPKR
jgi:hypothetical protein